MKSRDKVLGVHMIVKNEAARIAPLLSTVCAVADQVVVCDTGSDDDTVAIAARHGATVVHRAWDENFGAARQFALDHLTTRWALWLDADDAIDQHDLAMLRITLRSLPPHAVFLRLVCKNPPPEPDAQCWQLRCFPRVPGARWEGRVHEQVMPSLERIGLKTMNVPCQVTHHGYATKKGNRAKFQRNLAILSAMEGTDKDNCYLWYHMGQSYLNVGDLDRAEAYFTKVCNNGSRYPVFRNLASRSAALIAQLHVTRAQAEATRLLGWALDQWPKDDATRITLAEHLLHAGNVAGAYAVLQPLASGITDGLLPFPVEQVAARAGELLQRLSAHPATRGM